jgi:predicted DNA-binding WGR domain protein
MATREFEYTEGTSRKYWRITLDGKGHTVQFGRIGTSGQTQTKDFASEAQAKASYDKLIAEKLKKGYVEVGATGARSRPAAIATQKEAAGAPVAEANGALANAAPATPAVLATAAATATSPVAMREASVAAASTSVAPARSAAPKTVPAPPSDPGQAVLPEALTLEVMRTVDLRPVDWLWATWRPRMPWPRPEPKPFDLERALARLRSVSGAAYWAPLDWGKAQIGVSLTREEAAFWFAAMTNRRPLKRTWQYSLDGRVLAEDLASGAPALRPSHDHVFDALHAVATILTPEIVKLLATIFEPIDLIVLLKRDEQAVAGAQPGRPASIAQNLVAGFRAYWLPYLAEEDLQRLRVRLAGEIDLGAWPTNHYQVPPGVLHLAACVGMHDEMRALVNS